MLKGKVRQPNWGKLHSSLSDVYSRAGATRMKAVLESHSERKEIICRRLGVICDADVSRVASSLKPKIREGSL